MTTATDPPKRGYRTIRLPLAEADYERFISEEAFARAQLDQVYSQSPELFPEGWGQGYAFYGFTPRSRKQQLRCRRVGLTASEVVFSVAPAFVMPSMTATVAEVEKALCLMGFDVPCWAIAYVFGHDAMYGYRWQQGLGRFRVGGTPVKAPERLPPDLVADEKHSRLDGEKISIATTAGEGGASVSESASEAALTKAEQVFAEQARAVDPADAPETVNTDGWAATQGAWQRLFPTIAGMLCFLHAFLKIRDRATKARAESFQQVGQAVWRAYRAASKAAFAQRLRRLREWAEQPLPESPMKRRWSCVTNGRSSAAAMIMPVPIAPAISSIG